MSNSSLVSYTKLSPNCNKPRNHKIDKITIHHMAGVLSVETCGDIFAKSSRQASSNYGIGSDARVGLYVDEANRSWCSSSPANDHRAVTIEVSNSKRGGDWPVSDKVLARLIELCADICKRNGIDRLNYTGNTSGNLTLHKWFADTSCPGPYLESKMPYIAEEVNKILHPAPAPTPEPKPVPTLKFKEGDKVVITGGLYYTATDKEPRGRVSGKVTTITRTAPGTPHPYNTTGDLGWMNESDITLYTEPAKREFKEGDKVVPIKLVDYNGTPLRQYDDHYTITQIKGDRAVLSARGQVWAALNTANIRHV